MRFSTWFKKILLLLLVFFLIDFCISEVLLVGLNKYFGLNTNAKILINGSSMTIAGIDKTSIEHSFSKNVAFYARTGASLQDRNVMLNHYFNVSKSKTELVIFEVNPLLFSNKFTAENVYLLFLPFIDDPSMDAFIKSKSDVKGYWLRKIIRTSRYNTDLISFSIRGYLHKFENQKQQVLDLNALAGLQSQSNSVPVQIDPSKIDLFKQSIALIQKHSQKIILVNMPIFTTKMETFKSDEYEKYINTLVNFSKANNQVYFVDLNNPEVTKNPNYFSDPLHLNAKGQVEATKLLTSFITTNVSLTNK
jgi:hypothetical protein